MARSRPLRPRRKDRQRARSTPSRLRPIFAAVTAPTHDLSKLRIDRDPPPEVRRAFGRAVLYVAIALLLAGAALLYARNRSTVAVQTVVATPISTSGGGAGAAAATSVTANGYIVARTRASVSAKIPGRIASLTVD